MMEYATILCDPPWKFRVYDESTGRGRSAEAWYDCLSLEEIKALPIGDFAARDCTLFMWVTDPFLQKGLEVLNAWGFEFKTVGFYWAKCAEHPTNPCISGAANWPIGTGYWTRANPEQCLLATRGSPHRKNADVRKLIIAPRREHSRKPDEIYTRIERLCEGPYLELFARRQYLGWDHLISDEADSGPNERRCKSSGKSINLLEGS